MKSYVELLLQLCQFSECHITLHFQNTQTSLTLTRAEEHKRARMKVEEGVRLSLEAKRRAEEEHTRIEDEEEACLVEETSLKSEEYEKAQLRDDE